jgi:hypothetical protein
MVAGPSFVRMPTSLNAPIVELHEQRWKKTEPLTTKLDDLASISPKRLRAAQTLIERKN